jgi:3'-5' exonuclease
MSKIIFDIETVGEDFDAMDKKTQESLTNWIRQESNSDEEYDSALKNVKDRLGISPYTGQIVVIGVLDYEKKQGAIYYQAPGQKNKDFEENGYKFQQLTEAEMLEKFWQGMKNYDECVTFNGRAFDAPFLMARSAVHRIRPTVNLMPNRYIESQKFGIKHVDLYDQLSYYGAVRKKGSLHLWSRAFGIKSPKDGEINGHEVGKLFQEKKYLDIARYNVGDVVATKELYEIWDKYLRF